MNTPGHAVVNLLVLGKRDRRSLFAPIAFGAVLPDLPMFVFYAYQKSWLKAPERVIWAEAYHDLSWQAFFDVFNSLPLLALGGACGAPARAPTRRGTLPQHDAARRLRFRAPSQRRAPAFFSILGLAFSKSSLLLGPPALWRHRYDDRDGRGRRWSGRAFQAIPRTRPSRFSGPDPSVLRVLHRLCARRLGMTEHPSHVGQQCLRRAERGEYDWRGGRPVRRFSGHDLKHRSSCHRHSLQNRRGDFEGSGTTCRTRRRMMLRQKKRAGLLVR